MTSPSVRTARAVFVLLVALSAMAVGHEHGYALGAGDESAGSYVHVSKAPIPAFARMYGTACSTCHVAAPKLNVLGEAFRLNGYRMVDNDLLVRKDAPVPLGAEPWKDLWPRAIWPADIPGSAPLSLRIQSDLRVTRDAQAPAALSYDFPHEVYFLAGAPVGDAVSVFLEAEWKPEEGLELVQARASFNDVIPGLPEGTAKLTVGQINPMLFTFADRQIDRAGMLKFAWQGFSLASVPVTTASGEEVRSVNATALGESVAGLELSGLLGSRVHYGVGLAQSGSQRGEELNGTKDLYYRLRWKLGGLDLAGSYGRRDQPVLGTGGHLLDRSLTLEHFGFFGDDSSAGAPVGRHHATGWAARFLFGRLDAGVGHVRRTWQRPLGLQGPDASARSWFAKVEFLALPWVMGSLKVDRLNVDLPAASLPGGASAPVMDREVLVPGMIFLIRQNIRAVVEGELVLGGDARASADRRPHQLWIRLDLAF